MTNEGMSQQKPNLDQKLVVMANNIPWRIAEWYTRLSSPSTLCIIKMTLT